VPRHATNRTRTIRSSNHGIDAHQMSELGHVIPKPSSMGVCGLNGGVHHSSRKGASAFMVSASPLAC
jgi:hypothetical protein